MKYKIILTIPCLLAFFACNRENKDIEKVAYEYSMAMANYRFDDAKPFATEETIKTTIHTANVLIRNIDSAYIASDQPAHIEITDIKITSDTSAEATYHKTTPIKDFSGILQLRKRNGQWLAHVTLKSPQKQNSDRQSEFRVTDSITVNGKRLPLISRESVKAPHTEDQANR